MRTLDVITEDVHGRSIWNETVGGCGAGDRHHHCDWHPGVSGGGIAGYVHTAAGDRCASSGRWQRSARAWPGTATRLPVPLLQTVAIRVLRATVWDSVLCVSHAHLVLGVVRTRARLGMAPAVEVLRLSGRRTVAIR